MPAQRFRVLNVVEDGWGSARELTQALARELPLEVTHLIRGRVAPDVLRMITPRDGMHLMSVPRPLFAVVSRLLLRWGLLAHSWQLVVVDNERTLRAIGSVAQRRGVPIIEARETARQLAYGWGAETLDAAAVARRARVAALR